MFDMYVYHRSLKDVSPVFCLWVFSSPPSFSFHRVLLSGCHWPPTLCKHNTMEIKTYLLPYSVLLLYSSQLMYTLWPSNNRAKTLHIPPSPVLSFKLECSCHSPHPCSSSFAISCYTDLTTPSHHQALWLSGYSDRLEIYFLRERRFESCRRRIFCSVSGQYPSFCSAEKGEEGGWIRGLKRGLETFLLQATQGKFFRTHWSLASFFDGMAAVRGREDIKKERGLYKGLFVVERFDVVYTGCKNLCLDGKLLLISLRLGFTSLSRASILYYIPYNYNQEEKLKVTK